MPLDRGLFNRLDVPGAVAGELGAGNRLLPRRFDDDVLARDIDAVVSWVKPRVRRGQLGGREDVVLARKGWRGLRPLSVLSLTDRVAYRALVSLMAESLPEQVRSRGSNDDFRRAPLDVDGTQYVLQADVASFFQYVDHETLGDELLAQTGEEPAVDALLGLLGGVSGRRVGIPQISAPSDVLGDVYADPVRRDLARAGFAVFRYADDFRVACPSLGSALRALEACDTAARALGLTLNERKTLTFRRRRYERALDAFARREAELFDDESGDGADLAALEGPYGDGTASAEDVDAALGLTAGEIAVLDDEDALVEETDSDEGPGRRVAVAAARALELWFNEDESEDVQSTQDAAITQSLLSRALPLLGRAGDADPLLYLQLILTHEPALAPQIAAYLVAFAQSGPEAARSAREALDDVVGSDLVSPWQGMWLAHAAGGLPRRRGVGWPGRHVDWLEQCVQSGPPGLAATAAMALGRRRKGDPALLAGALDRVGPGWRPLAFLGLALLDDSTASQSASDALDRALLSGARPS